MKIEALVACSQYSDFLAWSLLWNKRHFDRLLVVTSHDDKATQALCEYHFIECLVTDAFTRDDKAFNKSEAINEGLRKLNPSDWVCQIDADIVLPPRTRDFLERAGLKKDTIYGIDRMMCKNFDDWINFVCAPEVQHASHVFVQANAFPLGVRIAQMQGTGYTPIGFFQMWHPSKSGNSVYSPHGTAHRGDMDFALKWPRQSRALIPEIVAIHLESENNPNMGANWRGRRTRPFGPHQGQHHHHGGYK